MYLRLDDAPAKVQDGGDPAWQRPKLLLAIPMSARVLMTECRGFSCGWVWMYTIFGARIRMGSLLKRSSTGVCLTLPLASVRCLTQTKASPYRRASSMAPIGSPSPTHNLRCANAGSR
jgi:hypothetical protein